MFRSLKNLYAFPYNRNHLVFATYRFIYWKFIRLLQLKNISYKLWGNRYIHLNYDSLQSMWIMYNYIVDWEEFNLISKIVKPSDTVFDVGANIGFYTIWMSKFVKTGTIHCFEPDSKTIKKLELNIKKNNLDSIVKINKCAVGDNDGEVNFTEGMDGENHIAAIDDESLPVISCKILKLDTYVSQQNIDRIKYIKIDVEGFEYFVLKGAMNLLQTKKIDIIQIEVNDTIKQAGIVVEDILKLIDKFNYTLCSYNVELNQLAPVNYSTKRENYFVVSSLVKTNEELACQKL